MSLRTTAISILSLFALAIACSTVLGEPQSVASPPEKTTFSSALLRLSEQRDCPLLAEVGTWMGCWSVQVPDSKAPAKPELPDDLLRRTDYRSREYDSWVLARSNHWFMMPQRDCDISLIRRIDQDGGLTLATAASVVNLSALHNNTLRSWLARPCAGHGPRCPELKLMSDPRCLAGLAFWASLLPPQVDRALRFSLWLDDLNPPQRDLLWGVLDEAAGLAPTLEAARGMLVALSIAGAGELTPEAKEMYLSQIGRLPSVSEVAPGELVPQGEVRLQLDLPLQSEPISVRLPVIGPEQRARRLEEKPLLDRLRVGKMKSLWPEKDQRSGLETPFTLWANVVKVKDVLLHITRECGVHLKADSWAGRRYLVANFERRTVDDFRTALAELLNCKWRYDEEDDYWLLYKPEETREEEHRLIAQHQAMEQQKYLKSETYEIRRPVWAAVLTELGAETNKRIRDGYVVKVPISHLPLEVQQQVVDIAYRSHLRDPSEDLPKAEDLVAGWLEFRLRGGVPGAEVKVILDFGSGGSASVGYIRTTLKGRVF